MISIDEANIAAIKADLIKSVNEIAPRTAPLANSITNSSNSNETFNQQIHHDWYSNDFVDLMAPRKDNTNSAQTEVSEIESNPCFDHEELITGDNQIQGFNGPETDAQTTPVHVHRSMINAYDYCRAFAHHLPNIINVLQPHLASRSVQPIDFQSLLTNPETLRQTLQEFNNLMFYGIQRAQSASALQNMNENVNQGSRGRYPSESSEQRVTEPDEDNDDEIDASVRIKPITLPSTVPKNKSNSTKISLSQLLQAGIESDSKSDLISLTFINQPWRLWKVRYLSDLAKNGLPEIQADVNDQRIYIKIAWTPEDKRVLKELYAFIQLLNCKDQPHQWKAPIGPSAKIRSTEYAVPSGREGTKQKNRPKQRFAETDIDHDQEYGYDDTKCAVLQLVTPDECRKCQMELRLKMFQRYERRTKISRGETESENERNLVKLRVCLCERTKKGRLRRVSESTDSNYMQNSKGKKELHIDESSISPQEICECGQETIDVMLNINSEKKGKSKGFEIQLNERSLKPQEFRGPQYKTISFSSIPKVVSNRDALHVMICKECPSADPVSGVEPTEIMEKRILLDVNLPYVKHSDAKHGKKRKSSFSSTVSTAKRFTKEDSNNS